MASRPGRRERAEEQALLWALVAVVAVLALLPLVRLAVEALMPGGAWSPAAAVRVLSASATWTATGHSLVTALSGTLLATLIGTVVALVVGLTDVRARNAYVFCFVMPLLLAPQVVALAWLSMAGPSSTLL